MNDKQEFIDIVEVVYRGARKGRGLVVSPKGKSFFCAILWKLHSCKGSLVPGRCRDKEDLLSCGMRCSLCHA